MISIAPLSPTRIVPLSEQASGYCKDPFQIQFENLTSSFLTPEQVKSIARILRPTKKTIIDPYAWQDKLHELFNDRPFAALLILKLDMVDERDSPLGIGYKSTGRAPSGKCFRIDVGADSDIATAFN